MFQPSTFYHYWVRPLVRTPGIDNEALQPKFELPLFDPSGPTDPNHRNLSYTQGAINAGPLVQVISGVPGISNANPLSLAGLLDEFVPNFRRGIE